MEVANECRRLLLLFEAKMWIIYRYFDLALEVEFHESGFRYFDTCQVTQQWILFVYRYLTVQVTLIACATSIAASSLCKTSIARFNTTSRKFHIQDILATFILLYRSISYRTYCGCTYYPGEINIVRVRAVLLDQSACESESGSQVCQCFLSSHKHPHDRAKSWVDLVLGACF